MHIAETPFALPGDLTGAVVAAFRCQRRAGGPEFHAWMAARREILARMPGLSEAEAGVLATRILAGA